jgi:hypothetical protein
MAVIRRIGGIKKKPTINKPMSKSYLKSRLPTTTHEDIERIRMLERKIIGNKGRIKSNISATTREDREIALALARQRERKGKLSKAEQLANLKRQKREGFPYL